MTALPAARFDTAALRQARPIAQLVTSYGIELRPSGRSLVGRCPFHDDRGRPNLHVYPADGRWWCFRCNCGGDAIDFVMRRDRLSFPEACRRLGAAPPATISSTAPIVPLAEARRWDRLTLEEQIVMNTACAVYVHGLWHE